MLQVLETLDSATLSRDEMEVEYEIMKEENEQLATQYEREKVN